VPTLSILFQVYFHSSPLFLFIIGFSLVFSYFSITVHGPGCRKASRPLLGATQPPLQWEALLSLT